MYVRMCVCAPVREGGLVSAMAGVEKERFRLQGNCRQGKRHHNDGTHPRTHSAASLGSFQSTLHRCLIAVYVDLILFRFLPSPIGEMHAQPIVM